MIRKGFDSERLAGAIEATRARIHRTRAILDDLPDEPRPGDVYVLPADEDLVVRAVVLRSEPQGTGRWLVVAADDHPYVGADVDLAVPAGTPGGAMTVRCAIQAYVGAARLPRERRIGWLTGELLATACALVRSAEAAPLRSRRDIDRDPDLTDWFTDRDAAWDAWRSRAVAQGDRATLLSFAQFRYDFLKPSAPGFREMYAQGEFEADFSIKVQREGPRFFPLRFDEFVGELVLQAFRDTGVSVICRSAEAMEPPQVTARSPDGDHVATWERVGNPPAYQTVGIFPWHDRRVELHFAVGPGYTIVITRDDDSDAR